LNETEEVTCKLVILLSKEIQAQVTVLQSNFSRSRMETIVDRKMMLNLTIESQKDLKLLKGKRLFPMFFNDEAWTSFSKDDHPFFIKLVYISFIRTRLDQEDTYR
jgi:hypothetical protein